MNILCSQSLTKYNRKALYTVYKSPKAGDFKSANKNVHSSFLKRECPKAQNTMNILCPQSEQNKMNILRSQSVRAQ